jgi:hypothetical protein
MRAEGCVMSDNKNGSRLADGSRARPLFPSFARPGQLYQQAIV